MTQEEVIADLQDILNGIPLIPTSDGWHAEEFKSAIQNLVNSTRSLVGALEGIESQFKQYKLGNKAAILITLRNIKQAAASLTKVINKEEPHLEADMCIAIAEQGLHQFQTETHTLTGKADAYMSKYPKVPSDPAWEIMVSDPQVAKLITTVIPPKDLERLCRDRLANGEELPAGCEVYIKASVGIRNRA